MRSRKPSHASIPGRRKLRYVQRALVILGIVFVAAGLAWPWLSKIPFGRLPGDIRIEGEGGGFWFPITTCIVVSIVLSLILWIFRR